jgi:hypothetical protein
LHWPLLQSSYRDSVPNLTFRQAFRCPYCDIKNRFAFWEMAPGNGSLQELTAEPTMGAPLTVRGNDGRYARQWKFRVARCLAAAVWIVKVNCAFSIFCDLSRRNRAASDSWDYDHMVADAYLTVTSSVPLEFHESNRSFRPGHPKPLW